MSTVTESRADSGGYDAGYRACGCFWGRKPGSLVRMLVQEVGIPMGAAVLDAGCGEGKNAVFLGGFGASVRAVDVSEAAIANARRAWGNLRSVDWEIADVRELSLPPAMLDVVVAYGLLHCLRSEAEIKATVKHLQEATASGGLHVVCVFNDRAQDLRAHPEFQPTLLGHVFYLSLYAGWEILHASDRDLFETHPHNGIPHSHSMTRLLARK
jgi:tellurite methyltransferase